MRIGPWLAAVVLGVAGCTSYEDAGESVARDQSGNALGAALIDDATDRRGGEILGDFDNEIRTFDGHFDTPRMIAALKQMGVNTYVYQIWHKPTDWADLPAFAAAAAREHISVWVWIMPWSMTPANKPKGRYSEPFQLDYVRWAQEIARLSLAHPNIVGYMIDDFYVNVSPDRFTPDYVKRMVAAGRAINPTIKCYPQLYFQQTWGEFVRRFGPLVDGVIVAYPESTAEVENALLYLNGAAYGPSFSASFGRRDLVSEGERAMIVADFAVTDAASASLSFYWNHTNRSDLSGYRAGYVKVNGRVIWEADCSSKSPDRMIRLNLAKVAAGQQTIQVEVGVSAHRSGRFPLIVRMDDVQLTGVEPPPSQRGDLWAVRRTGGAIVPELTDGGPASSVRLPMILMVAAEPYEHELRYSQTGNARSIGRKMDLAAELWKQGLLAGIVTYCAPKDANDEIFKVVRGTYEKVRGGP